MLITSRDLAAVVAAAGIIVACAEAARAQELREVTREGQLSPRLLKLGTHGYKVTTSSADAQRYFNQGLVLAYGFNHAEAVRSFREAARLDPQCAMAYWGEAYALGPNINAPMDPSAGPQAWAAVQKALALRDRVTPKERDLINAMARRYAENPPEDRGTLDRAFAEAMLQVADRYPDDSDILAIAAEAQMDLMPWNYYTPDGKPRPATIRTVQLIDRAVALNGENPLALHLHIHIMEPSLTQAHLAEPSADRLATLVPGAGHLVHMPAHIYLRIGRYADAAEINVRASMADEEYIAQCRAQGIYPAAYYPHNVHFLWIARVFQGRHADALEMARKTATHASDDLGINTEQMLVPPVHTLVRFGMWDDILVEPRPAEGKLFHLATWHYARGMALAAKGRPEEAASELTRVRDIARSGKLPTDMLFVYTPAPRLMELAGHMLAGQIAGARGNWESAINEFEAAVRLEGATVYNEPPDWPYSPRHWLGAALLKAGRPVEAESVYWEDLRHRPENGWALLGLIQSLKAQGGRDADVELLESRFRRAWSAADVRLKDSRN